MARPEHPTFDEMKREYFTNLIKLCGGEMAPMIEVSGVARASVYRFFLDHDLNQLRADVRAERKALDVIKTQTTEIDMLKERLSQAESALTEIKKHAEDRVSRKPIQIAHEYLAKWGLNRNY